MELNEEFNKKYVKDKKAYDKLGKTKEYIKKLEAEIKKLTRQKEDFEKNKERAIEDKDKSAEKNADAAIKLTEEEIKKREANLARLQEIVKNSKEKVVSYIQELSKDPEFKAYINSILEKRYNRKIKKAMHEKAQIDLIINLCDKHPSLENNLKGMIRAKEEVEKLDEELKTLDPIKDKARIDEINNTELPSLMSKRDMNKNSFMDFCTRNNINIDEKFLDNLIKEKSQKKDGEKDYSFAHDKKTGEILLSKTLKNISKGYDKQINAYEKSIQKIPGAKVYVTTVEENRPQNAPRRTGTRQGTNNQYQTPSPLNNEEEKEDSEKQSNLPAKKFKWWQFGKKFNAWRERNNVKKEIKANEGKAQESSKKFRDAYKYDVVKDYVEKLENTIDKQVRKESKNQNRDEEER